ncbi:MAG: radical SAM protein [Candidatus Aminicenantes bacterium]|nr:radical SAM protein [Candidatus Aminicenantes bacterium]
MADINIEDDLLIGTLPAIKKDKDEYLIFSPYHRIFIKLNVQQVRDKAVIKSLDKAGLFEIPDCSNEESLGRNKTRIVLTTTKKCNLYCKYCFARSGPNEKQEMSSGTATSIIKNISKSSDIERIHFTGGEPTLNFKVIKDVVSLLETKRNLAMPVFYITTNGIMPKSKLNWLIGKKFAFSVSWDGINDDQRTDTNGENSEKITKETIIKISKSGLPLRVRMAVSKKNLKLLFESVEWLVGNDIKFIHIDPIVPDGRGEEFVKKFGVDNEEFIDEFFRIVDFAEKNDVWILNSSLSNLFNPRGYYCTSFKDRINHFNPDGSISYCYRIQSTSDTFGDDFIIGDFGNKNINICEEKAKKLSAIDVGDYPELEEDPYKYFFSSGCPVRNYSINKNWGNINENSLKLSKSMYRKAIFHLYDRASSNQRSALEGYLHFYKHLIPKVYLEKTPSKNETNYPLLSNEITHMPGHFINQDVEIDACDICI